MNTLSRTLAGGVIILMGLFWIFFIGFIDGPGFDLSGFLIGVPFIILGIFVLLNKKEDEIEQIKSESKLKVYSHSLNRSLSNERRKRK